MTLFLKSTDPQAGLKTRRWREKCRREGRVSLVIYEDEDCTHVEIREPEGSGGYIDLSPIHQAYGMVGSSRSTSSANLSIPGRHSGVELGETVRRALALQRKPPRIFDFSEPTSADNISRTKVEQSGAGWVFVTETEMQRPRLIFSQEEYEIVTAAVLAVAENRPVPFHFLSRPNSFVDYPPEIRLHEWPAKAVHQLMAKEGEYTWEPRFGDAIVLKSDGPADVTCSRPGIAGKLAVVQFESVLQVGFALLEKGEQGWGLVQVSLDADWSRPSWEFTDEDFDSLTVRIEPHVPKFEEWSRYPIPFPCPPGKFVQPVTVAESHQIHEAVCKGLSKDGEFVIPTCHGHAVSPAALLSEAKETFEIHLNSSPTKITEQLAEEGTTVVLLSHDSSPSISKLLAYWGRDFSLIRVDDVYGERVAPTEEQKPRLNQLSSIFKNAGIRGVSFALSKLYSPTFFFLPAGSDLARSDQPAPFDHVGTVLISQYHADTAQVSLERLLTALCAWGDPTGSYTDAILEAASHET